MAHRHMLSIGRCLPYVYALHMQMLYIYICSAYPILLSFSCQIRFLAKTDHRSQRLMELKGIGPTTACALVASIGNAHDFKNGRQLAAWLGLTPSQYSSGGKSKLGRITKAGDSYLRTLLVQGARSVLIGAEKRTDSFSRWVCMLVERRGYWRAVVAIAAKNARLCWASLHYGDDFRLYSAS